MDKIPLHIVLFDKDLRVHDHACLARMPHHEALLCLYLMPTPDELKKMSPLQQEALARSLDDLAHQLAMLNIPFSVEEQDLIHVLDRLKPTFQLITLSMYSSPRWDSLWQTSIHTHFPRVQVTIMAHPTLLDADTLPFSISELPRTFTAFRHEVERHISIRKPQPQPEQRMNFLPIETSVKNIQSLRHPDVVLPQRMGETAALKHLHDYFFVHHLASTYKKTRNGLLRFQDSTRFSPYLAWGNLSALTIYEQLKRYEQTIENNESTYWIWFELLWRDYFYFLLHDHSRPNPKDIDWNHPLFLSWIQGTTGYPLVDASMRELQKTGWMSNRGRQNVASFFVHGLKLPWSWGEAYFQSTLIDYDRTSNLGNWQYLAGVGVDPREHRVFNVTLQFKKYDSRGEYVKHWLPELTHVPVPWLYQPWTMNHSEQERYRCTLGKDYPTRIIQDARFYFAERD